MSTGARRWQVGAPSWVGRLPHRYWRVPVILAALYGHVLAFPFLYRLLGGAAPPFAVVLAIFSGAFWGLWGGLLSAAAISILIALQLDVLEHLPGWRALYGAGVPGALALLLVGGSVGRLCDLSNAVKRELSRRHQAEASAEAASRAKSEFLSRMSHELRTPLNSILGFAQLLELDPLSPEQRDSVAQILRGGQHLLGLINEVLDISRIETGHLNITVERVSVLPVVREAFDMVRTLAAEQSVRLYAEDGPAGPVVHADRQRLRQVLLNLLSNAVKYNRAGGTVSVACAMERPGRVRISVRDTGRGIPAEQLERVFVPFARPGAATSSVEGIGIGLALSRALVRLMGGEIGVSSLVDHGSTFWVELPSADLTPEAVPQTPLSRQPTAEAAILYIDENLTDLELLRHVLNSRYRIRLLTARQAAQGVEQARAHRPDLILLDTDLADLTAEEVLHRLESHLESRTIPVVILGGEGTAAQMDRLFALGAQGFLAKPINVRHLLKTVDEHLARSRAGRGEEVSAYGDGSSAGTDRRQEVSAEPR